MSEQRRIVRAKTRVDLAEVVFLSLEAMDNWSKDRSASEDLNMAANELSKTQTVIKSIERSGADDDSINIYMTDGTSYRVYVTRTDSTKLSSNALKKRLNLE